LILRFLPEFPVALKQIECPECGAALKSADGFTDGEAVDCPKCEAAFTVNAARQANKRPRDEDEEGGERSYKRSPGRYAGLGVLLAVMIVLGVMLVMKNQRDRESEEHNAKLAGRDIEPDDEPIAPLPPRTQPPPGRLPFNPVPLPPKTETGTK